MNNLTCDYVIIDTNVFEQLLNPQENYANHIDKLLETLLRDGVCLIVDEERRIENEYKNRFEPRFKNNSVKNIQQLLLLRYWIVLQIDKRKRVCVSDNDPLMITIKGIIAKGEAVDCTFVYVAFKCGRILITNDREHIIEGRPKKRTERRKTLLKNTRKHRPNQRSEILSSSEAVARL